MIRKPVRSIAEVSANIPGGCYCPPGQCGAPVIMGMQTPCLRREEGAEVARTKEQRLWDRFRPQLQRANIYVNRVENVMVAGMPDVICVCRGKVSWVEEKAVYKVPFFPKTPLLGDKDGLSVPQRNWHYDWHKNGGTSYVLIGIGQKEIIMMDGSLADEINKMPYIGMIQQCVARDWPGVVKALGAR